MSNEAKRFNTAVNESDKTYFDVGGGSEMFRRFNEALTQKIWLTGKEVEFEGEMIDMNHFEFMMACLKLPPEVNRYHLQQFYASLWPYIKKIVNSYKSLDTAFALIVNDQEEVLKNYANQNLELDISKRFFKTLPNEYRMKFKKFKEAEEERIEKAKEAAIEREKAFREKIVAKKEKKDLERKYL